MVAVADIGEGRLEVDGWTCPDRESALADAQRTIEVLDVPGRLIVEPALASVAPLADRATPADVRFGLPLLRELVESGHLVHDVTPELDAQLGEGRVRAVQGGLALGHPGPLGPCTGRRAGRAGRRHTCPRSGHPLALCPGEIAPETSRPVPYVRPSPITPNDNDPVEAAPGTVGPPDVNPGDPNGLVLEDGGPGTPRRGPPGAMPWSGWPAEWATPSWSQVEGLVDTAWMCLDLNSSIIASMPPYATTDAGLVPSPMWLDNPDPDHYTSWNEFAKQLWWDYQMGEAFVLCTARYANGYPARFHVVEPWLVTVDMVGGLRTYSIGSRNVDDDLLHIRYKSTTGQCRGTGPLDAGASRMVAAGLLQRYASTVVAGGGVPYYVIKHPQELNATQVAKLQAQWWESRMNSLGMPAILSGGIEIEELQISPADMALLDLSRYTDSRIAVLLGVPPFLAGLPSGGDSMTYSNTVSPLRLSLAGRAQTQSRPRRQCALAVGAPAGHRRRGEPRRVRAARPARARPDMADPRHPRRAHARAGRPARALRHHRPESAAIVPPPNPAEVLT